MARKKSIPVEQLSEETQKLYDVLNEESDLACVLIGASFLDNALRSLLERFFIEDESVEGLFCQVNGPLSSFGNRSDLAHALGLISRKCHGDFKTIGKIRNKFAHAHLTLDFAKTDIMDLTDSLNTWRLLEHTSLAGHSSETLSPAHLRRSTRNKFNLSIILLANKLLVDTLGLKHRARQEELQSQTKKISFAQEES